MPGAGLTPRALGPLYLGDSDDGITQQQAWPKGVSVRRSRSIGTIGEVRGRGAGVGVGAGADPDRSTGRGVSVGRC